ncbi:MAG TPA: hypothetical protein VK492_08000 [Chitinophagaceae bacterium]|nr:hypothetical protein [Chitinophagaceae bacterium]
MITENHIQKKPTNSDRLLMVTSSDIEKELLKIDGSLADFDDIRITKEKAIPQAEPLITIAGAAIAAPGNITAIGAAAKVGKTALVSVIAAGAISETGNIDGLPGLEVQPNTNRHAVIGFDTEQSDADQQHNVNVILKRSGFASTPDYALFYNLRQINFQEYEETTYKICEYAYEKFGGIRIIIVDGGADYVLSVNDEEKAKLTVQFFTHLAIKYSCPVLVVVHQNPGSDKERGHFGSEIQRKCYGLLTLTREGDISKLSPKIMRKASHADIPLISFRYSKEKGYHIAVDTDAISDSKATKERERLRTISEYVFKPLAAHTHKNSVSMIMQHTNKRQSTAKTMLGNMEGFGYVIKGDDGLYRINIEGSTKVNDGQSDPVMGQVNPYV